ncbi:hypothetical protein PVAP13_9NG385973 [Panicum virgatum]|uniref:Uncharacterized protein n=1 Tax=Panicum virgatum TaxID=38727 RepID=A0A8T0MSU8_PANVG|nr:hypothetical protein PVAP13_9NG385973 [Panicum virgatum]
MPRTAAGSPRRRGPPACRAPGQAGATGGLPPPAWAGTGDRPDARARSAALLPWPPRRSLRAMVAVDEGTVAALEGAVASTAMTRRRSRRRGAAAAARAGGGADARTRAGFAAARFAGDEEANRVRRSALLS